MLLFLLACSGGRFGETGGFLRFDSSGTDVLDTGDFDITEGVLTLDCGRSTLSIGAFADGVVRLRRGEPRDSWAVVPPTEAPAEATFVIYTDVIVVSTADMRVIAEPDSCRVTVEDIDGAIVYEEPAGGGDGLQRVLAEGERVYGLGERTGVLDRRGGSYRCWNTDAYDADAGGWTPDADPLYQCVPFYVSLLEGNALGVFTDITHETTWDVGATDANLLSVTTDAEDYDQYLVAGPGISTVVEGFTRLTGRPPLPPRWSLGFHQSRWGWSPDTAVTDVVDEFRARELPLDAVWLDIQHLDGFRSWTWDPATFPDPSGLVDTLATDGVRAVSIVDPAIKVDPEWELYTNAEAQGYFLQDDGATWVGTVWPGDAAFPDFSDRDVRAWWGGLAATDLDHGVAGLWLDMNEPSEFTNGTVPDTLDASGDGDRTTMAEVHNVYGLLEARASFEGLESARPDRRPFLLSRAAYSGIQRYAATWTGDAPSTWDSLQATLPMLLGMGLSGQSWVGSDVGGYSGGADGELYARWMMLGALSPFFRAHLVDGAADQYPWSFGTEVLDISRAVLELRYSLLPTWYSLAYTASTTGAPPLRPLSWAFQADEAALAVEDQAMIGDHLLVAPILVEGATSRSVYLPEGRWYEYTTGTVFEGPATVTRADLPLAALPMFVREGGILAKAQPMAWSEEAAVDLTIEVFPGDGTFTLYEDEGDGYGTAAITTWTAELGASGLNLVAERTGDRTFEREIDVHVRRVDHEPSAVTLDGRALTEWTWDDVDLSLHVTVPDTGSLELAITYDTGLLSNAPAVAMPFRVTVPDGTPVDTPISIATSADGWVTHTALTWVSATEAEGTLEVPRGEYVYYKYTRGSWDTVEKWPDCVEASNRYELGRAAEKVDTVYGWGDWCG
jgi:alpha-glucosidase